MEQKAKQSGMQNDEMAGCPVFPEFNPISPEAISNPHPWFARARKETPIFFIPEFNLWAVTRHEDVLTVFRDTETFSSLRALGEFGEMPDEIRAEVGDDYVWPLTSQLTITDPPQHDRIRKLIQRDWTPRSAESYSAEIKQIAEGLIDKFADQGCTDLMPTFAGQLPAMVITKLVGAPVDMAMQFHDWVGSFFMLAGNADLSEELRLSAWRDVIEMERYTRDLIARHRSEPHEDLITDMINARSDDGEPALDDQEIMGNVLGFIGAGSDTSSMLIAHTVYLLLQDPERWDRVKGDQSLLKKAIEETLRYRPSAVSVRRTTTREVVLSGVTLPKGADIWLNLASANRDEEAFQNPEEFDIDRPDVGQHLSLGKWTHFCLGGPLARLETRIALESLIERLPGLRIASDQGPLDYSLNMIAPEILGLRVEWNVS